VSPGVAALVRVLLAPVVLAAKAVELLSFYVQIFLLASAAAVV